MIEIKNLSKSYGKTSVLEKVNLPYPKALYSVGRHQRRGKIDAVKTDLGRIEAERRGNFRRRRTCIRKPRKRKARCSFCPTIPIIRPISTARAWRNSIRPFTILTRKHTRSISTNLNSAKSAHPQFFKGHEASGIRVFGSGGQTQISAFGRSVRRLDPLARMVFKRGLIELVEEKKSAVIISSPFSARIGGHL